MDRKRHSYLISYHNLFKMSAIYFEENYSLKMSSYLERIFISTQSG